MQVVTKLAALALAATPCSGKPPSSPRKPGGLYFTQHPWAKVRFGYWIPQQSDPELGISAENTIVYMRGYPSKEERDKRLVKL